ncbi:helix-turn-helix domain-containing protein [Longimicrobium terrae]|uniref:Transcriptional regulator with XRE-family HTH domain n=1 Tax=Longimicrobium terrae TaxID=1639882 RepID=A0A841GZC2_9BACT|nr:helix-turn-helix transcriptional regulator [Longimicrobium terrae]MBB4636447.1 transcriptional regulator with XRE-family HTH domain [Longimicrobium terrae]MBB6071029.1 transcriptional regulator with XRE-family HTH domain [Longimicrobium terrae]NNC29050.1 helix-turn-helix transcriptional regulator [Longimicrobium terrae]
MTVAEAESPFGAILRRWRAHRHLSQLALALKADTSQRHLSFIESGRARPSRQMVLHLADHLQLPLRERNGLLLAAGYAPVFAERPLDDPALAAVRDAVALVLRAHEPLPALAIDRHWNLIAANAAIAPLLRGVAEPLLQAPVNVLRLSLHPDGLAPRIVNLAEWRAHLLERLARQIEASADPVLSELLDELTGYPAPRVARSAAEAPGSAAVFVPMQLDTEDGVLSLISTTTVFGTPVDVTVSELAIESFFPADAATAERLRGMAAVPLES